MFSSEINCHLCFSYEVDLIELSSENVAGSKKEKLWGICLQAFAGQVYTTKS